MVMLVGLVIIGLRRLYGYASWVNGHRLEETMVMLVGLVIIGLQCTFTCRFCPLL